jgi:hypothetical protein
MNIKNALTITVAVVLIFGFILVSCTNPYTNEKANEYLTQASKPYSNFMDKYMLANTTPRMSLTTVITDMQDYKIEFNEIEPPEKFEELKEAKKLCVQGMEKVIEGFLSFQSQEDDNTVTSLFQVAEMRFNDVEEILSPYENSKLFIDSRYKFFDNQVAASQTVEEDTTPKLQLLSHDGDTESDYIIVEGQIKNISTEKLENVEALVEFFDENDNFIKSDSALIEYDILLPDQTSPFKVMTITNPEIKIYRVSFKYFSGGKIYHIK